MELEKLTAQLEERLQDQPMLDAHTHLTNGKLAARGLHDVLLYHMVVSDLYSAGCPTGSRLTEFPGWPTDQEAHARVREAIPFLPSIRNTSCFWGLRILLRDLYGWTEDITADNWQRLDGLIRERRDDQAWPRRVLQKANVRRLVTELARRQDGADDDILQYSMEWAFFTRTQRGEFDTAVYELERCWGKPPGSPIPHGAAGRARAEREIHTVADVHAAMDHFIKQVRAAGVLSIATHVSSDIEFRRVSDETMAGALARRDRAGREERDIYASYVHEAFLAALETHAPGVAFQFSLAAEPLPHETASLIPQRAIGHLADRAADHPKVKFLCLVASRHADQSLCTLCRELPNFALMGYWWHNFFPDAIRQVMSERLDMLAVNKQIGFFSDAYCLEWTYAKSQIVRKMMARVLAEKVTQGQYSIDEALRIAHELVYRTPRNALGIKA
jgi:glucuronate isomerase